MSITPELRASARATYRLLFRTAVNTFRGDDHVLNAFREKVRTEFRQGRSITEASAYTTRIQLGKDVAGVLRKNIVQGVKVYDAPRAADSIASTGAAEAQQGATVQADGGVWRLRLTKDTELGSNESLKSGPSSRRSGGVQSCCQSSATAFSSSAGLDLSGFELESEPSASPKEQEDERAEVALDEETTSLPVSAGTANASSESTVNTRQDANPSPEPGSSGNKKLNYTTLKRLSQNRVKPVLNEDDLEESFVRGSGPGGQSINKTANNVQLLHKPTGIRVSCQETRSLQSNRLIARKILLEKLDQIANPGLSKEGMKRAKQVERERRRRKKAKKKKEKDQTQTQAKAEAEADEDDDEIS